MLNTYTNINTLKTVFFKFHSQSHIKFSLVKLLYCILHCTMVFLLASQWPTKMDMLMLSIFPHQLGWEMSHLAVIYWHKQGYDH